MGDIDLNTDAGRLEACYITIAAILKREEKLRGALNKIAAFPGLYYVNDYDPKDCDSDIRYAAYDEMAKIAAEALK